MEFNKTYIKYLYDYDVVVHEQFYQDVNRYSGVIALSLPMF